MLITICLMLFKRLTSQLQSQLHIYYSEYTVDQLKDLTDAIRDSCYLLGNESHVLRKYADRRFRFVSIEVKEELERTKKLSFKTRDIYGEP